MDIALLTRSVTFAAAHGYHRPEWDDARSLRLHEDEHLHVEYFGGAHMPA